MLQYPSLIPAVSEPFNDQYVVEPDMLGVWGSHKGTKGPRIDWMLNLVVSIEQHYTASYEVIKTHRFCTIK